MKVCALSLKIFLPCPRRVFAGSTVKNLLAKPCSNRAHLATKAQNVADVYLTKSVESVSAPPDETQSHSLDPPGKRHHQNNPVKSQRMYYNMMNDRSSVTPFSGPSCRATQWKHEG
ncbi:hypothetical protein CSKR_102021 [Clonorchis sinensis]|uniref:Uncharacterized protein n=1 Tax=Clonorchis sinensis TaxID=79923 RepID=A0A419PM60_CLOSI|nr:hypothetical protein CSKR_102021 [Clonorchis sinensis]